VMLGPALPLQKGRFGAQDCRNGVDSWTVLGSWFQKLLSTIVTKGSVKKKHFSPPKYGTVLQPPYDE